jgi:hypothetical protein
MSTVNLEIALVLVQGGASVIFGPSSKALWFGTNVDVPYQYEIKSIVEVAGREILHQFLVIRKQDANVILGIDSIREFERQGLIFHDGPVVQKIKPCRCIVSEREEEREQDEQESSMFKMQTAMHDIYKVQPLTPEGDVQEPGAISWKLMESTDFTRKANLPEGEIHNQVSRSPDRSTIPAQELASLLDPRLKLLERSVARNQEHEIRELALGKTPTNLASPQNISTDQMGKKTYTVFYGPWRCEVHFHLNTGEVRHFGKRKLIKKKT